MVHRKIIDPVLKNLGPSRADYFNRLGDRVEHDPPPFGIRLSCRHRLDAIPEVLDRR